MLFDSFSNQKQRGISMIEVLVTIVVISFGLLGIAGLQAKALQHAYSNYQRTLATIQAIDLVERMWGGVCYLNPNAADDEASDEALASIQDLWADFWEDPANNPRMPDWEGAVEWDADGETFLIEIKWNNEEQIFQYRTLLPQLSDCP